MFRLRSVELYNGIKRKSYFFSDNAYVYGNNSLGKTALTKVIDYVLGSGKPLYHDGLDNIDAVGAYIVNNKTELWIKRSLQGDYYYKRTKNSGYSTVSKEAYKEAIGNVITETVDIKALSVYRKVFEENPTYRSFSFLNFVDEIGQGDLGAIFTRGKDFRHLIRIRNIMDFFFNYDNIEKIYDKRIELENLEQEQKSNSEKLNQYLNSLNQIQILFNKLNLQCFADMSVNYDTFKKFQNTFTRTKTQDTGDLAYLIRASYSLAEELKVYSFLKEQTRQTEDRKTRTERLLSVLQSIIANNKEYAEDINSIERVIKEIEQDKLILSLADYDVSIKKIRDEKQKIDEKINILKSQSSEMDYEDTLKVIALLENHFNTINNTVDINKNALLTKQINDLKKQIKKLKNSYNQKSLDIFNDRLTELYLYNNIKNIKYLNDDRMEEQFSLVFDPFSQILLAKHTEDKVLITYAPGSMARHTHLQLLVYLCMLEYLHKSFENFIYLPLLVIDSADQSMTEASFEEIYPSLVEIANGIGVQTIFLSKTKISTVSDSDLIDISDGLNPFHQRSTS